MKISVIHPGGSCADTKLTTDKGVPLGGVSKLVITLEAGKEPTAMAEFWIGPSEITAVPIAVSLEHLVALADQQGFSLVKK